MKSRQSQTGSAHVVIIIVLVVALVGVLGFVFWQNFINKPVANRTSTSQAAQTQTTADKTLAISEWGVKGIYTGDKTYTYTIDSSGDLSFDAYTFQSGCWASGISRAQAGDQAGFSAGSTVSNMTAKDAFDAGSDKWGAAHVGDYYYFVINDPGTCSTGDTSGQQAAFAAIKSIVASLSAN